VGKKLGFFTEYPLQSFKNLHRKKRTKQQSVGKRSKDPRKETTEARRKKRKKDNENHTKVGKDRYGESGFPGTRFWLRGERSTCWGFKDRGKRGN